MHVNYLIILEDISNKIFVHINHIVSKIKFELKEKKRRIIVFSFRLKNKLYRC